MRVSRTTKKAYIAMAACVVVAGLLPPLSHLIGTFLDPCFERKHIYTFACYTAFIFIWVRLLRYRLVSQRILSYMTAAAGVMLFWLAVRTVKFELIEEFPLLKRYAWYSYYVGYTLMPALLLLGVLHIGKRADERLGPPAYVVLGVASVLALLVLTNDLHQLAFRFTEPLDVMTTDDRSPYHHGPAYYLVVVWLAALVGVALVITVGRCARTLPRYATLVPLGIVLCALLYSVSSALSEAFSFWTPYKITEAACIASVLFMESLVALGLFPVNERYGELWQASSLNGAIMDAEGTVVFATKNAPQVTKEQVSLAISHPQELSGNEVLTAQRVSGGVAFWVRDLSRVRALQGELEELGDMLAEENAALAAENELVHEREAVVQRQALYRGIARRTDGQLRRLEELLGDVPADEASFLAAMHRAALEATYVKRCANLTLVGGGGTVETGELALALGESASWLRSCGASVVMMPGEEGVLPTERALAAYERFQAMAETLEAGDRMICRVTPQGIDLHKESKRPRPGGAEGRGRP